MGLAELRAALQSQADRSHGLLTVTAAVVGAASLAPREGFDGLLASSLGLPEGLTVRVGGALPAPAGRKLAFIGAASLLGLSDVTAEVEFVFPDEGPTLDLRLYVHLGDGWKFGRSFPAALGYPFDRLTLDDAYYLFTTAPKDSYVWRGRAVELAQGLNYVSTLGLGGPLGVLEGVLEAASGEGEGDVTFSGTVGLPDPGLGRDALPHLSLAGSIGRGVKAIPKYFPLSNPRVTLESGRDAQGSEECLLSFVATLSIEGEAYGDLKAAVIKDSSSLGFWFIPSRGITAETIVKLMGGEDFTRAIPSELRTAFEAVGLKALGLAVDVRTLRVGWLSAAVGSTKAWEMGEFTVEDVSLNYTLLDPFGNRDSIFHFVATSKLFPKVFKDGVFEVEISYDLATKAVGVAAGYRGSVSLSDLVAGLSGGDADISGLGFDITFSDFGVTFASRDGGGYDYTLYGKANSDIALPMMGGKLQADFSAYVQSATKSYKLVGGFKLGESHFQAEADLGQTQKLLTASWAALDGRYLGIDAIASELGLGDLGVPAGLDLGLKSASITYDLVSKSLTLEADSVNYGDVALASGTGTQGRYYAAGIKVKDLELSRLPLVGDHLKSSDTLGLRNLQIWIVPQALTPDALNKLNGALSSYGQLPAGSGQGVSLKGEFELGAKTYPFGVQLGAGATPQNPTQSTTQSTTQGAAGGGAAAGGQGVTQPAGSAGGAGQGAPPAAGSSAQWFNVQKGLGPLWFSRVGVEYARQKLYVLLDASVTLAGLTVELDGLSAGSSLTDFSPSAHLDGLGLAFKGGALQISGELLAAPEGSLSGEEYEYDGAATIKTPEFSVGALASYAKLTDGQISLFLFAFLDAPLGGPSFFFVTGLAAGLGYNRAVTIPAPDQVQNFPLVAFATGTQQVAGATLREQFGSALSKLTAPVPKSQPPRPYIYPAPGEYWVAAGVRFSSFEVIDSFALLLVEFGKEFEIAVLGLSKIQLPKQIPGAVPPVVYAELALEVVIIPSEGVLRATAELTNNSWVLDAACRLTGGFAFYAWFAGDHKGDFVVTLGGYHPSYTPPGHYPKVPRLALNWPCGKLRVSGNVYFALTPSCVMAGGTLSAVYQSGDLRAWFDAQADFLIKWKPFAYDIKVSVSVGASYTMRVVVTKTFKVELGVTLHLWGPKFGGRARVNWYVISFTVAFGAESLPADDPVDWEHFSSSFLPPAPRGAEKKAARLAAAPAAAGVPAEGAGIVGVNVTGGLVRKEEDGTWLVKAESFAFATRTAVPATQVGFDSARGVTPIPSLDASGRPVVLGIRPMGKTKISSVHTVGVSRIDAGRAALQDLTHWERWPALSGAPAALWATTPLEGVPASGDAGVIKDAFVGAELRPAASPDSYQGPPAIALGDLGQTEVGSGPLPLAPAEVGVAPVAQPPDPLAQLAATVMDPGVTLRRRDILRALSAAGADVMTDVDLSLLKLDAARIFDAPPTFGALGTVPGEAAAKTVQAAPMAGPTPRAAVSARTDERGAGVGTAPRLLAGFRSYLHTAGRGRGDEVELRGLHRVTGTFHPAGARATTSDLTHLRGLAAGGASGRGGRPRMRLHHGATLLWELGGARAGRREIRFEGSLPVRVAVFDAHHLLLEDAAWAPGGADSHALPDGAALLALTGFASDAMEEGGPVGWYSGSTFIQVNPVALLGDHVVVRPEVPLTAWRGVTSVSCGMTDATRLLARNRVPVAGGGRVPGWIETLLPRAVNVLYVSVKGERREGPGRPPAVPEAWLVRELEGSGGPAAESVALLPREGGAAPGGGLLLYDLPEVLPAEARPFRRVRIRPGPGSAVDGVVGTSGGAGAAGAAPLLSSRARAGVGADDGHATELEII